MVHVVVGCILVCTCRRLSKNGLYYGLVVEYVNGINSIRYAVTKRGKCSMHIVLGIIEGVSASVLVAIRECLCMRAVTVVAGVEDVRNQTDSVVEVSICKGVICVKEMDLDMCSKTERKETAI